MKYKLKKMFTNTRIIIVLVFIVLALVAIRPSFSTDGVAIRTIARNSSAELAGIENPKAGVNPMSREVIKYLNDEKITNLEDYERIISNLKVNDTLLIETNRDTYRLIVKPKITRIKTNETFINELNETEIIYEEIVTSEIDEIGLNVYNAPTNNIRKGLDIQGGTRVLLSPEKDLTPSEMEMVIESMKQRLNVYGLSDLVIREAGDLPPPLGQGRKYILVEIAGINEEEVTDLLSNQGKFEAKIGNEIGFIGGRDITYVCRSPECSGIDPNAGCTQIEQQQEMCRFRFSITITQEAANKMASLTKDLAVVTVDEEGNTISESNQYLNQTLDFYLDNVQVDSLNIGKELKGSTVTDIQISGSGVGVGRSNAIIESLQNMKRLQTVLITGSLPVEINIEKVDTISPILGQKFMKNAIIVGIIALLSVGIVVFIRYRTLKVVVPILSIMISELIILLGVAALIRQNIDLAAIAGILVSVGTGVDDQIVITDETIESDKKEVLSWKKRLKNAFFIIFAAYSLTVVAMIPLLAAGAGLLKGFAVTTIIGVTIGVLITRPAFAKILEILMSKD
jgi:preprotein translocase subunit SecD